MSANQLVEVKTSPNLEVNLDLKPYLNLALAQNGIPWLNLEINNRSPLSLAKLQVKIQATPGFAHPYEETMGPFKAGERLFQENLELPLDFEYLANLRDVQPAALRVESTLPSHPSEVRNYSLTLYPPDQWLGLNFLPELLVSYVTPQLQLITQTLSLVAEELRRTTGSPSIEGYQKGKERAYAICQAAYRTLHSWGIRYTEPLHSWSDPGQRVRLIPDLYKNRQGTCLDTTLLLASLLERCGLNPVLMLTSGHAYLGCHLVERFFPDLLTDDLQLVRKLVDLDEFLVLETTQLTGANTFEEAEKLARQRHLFNSTELWAFDVQRARLSHIRPLPLVDSEEGEIAYKPQAPALPTPQLPAEELRSLKADLDLRQLAPPTRDRLQRWTQKLLDLSLRNRLLNTKSVSTVVPITCTELGLLEDKLSAQQAFKFFPLEEIAPQAQPTNTKRASQAPPQLHKLLHGELEAGRLRVPLSAYDLKRRLTDLYRQSRNELEEGGANTLFLALGFLEWKASSRDAKSYWAPLLLLPVRLVRPSIAIGIHLERLEEETILNATLMELLRSQFGLVPPGLDPLPTDHSGVDVPLIFDIFRQAVKDRPGWEVHEEVRLGLFSFSKFIMWKDLSQRTEALKANPLVRHLLENQGAFEDGVAVYPPEQLEEKLSLGELYCPLSADSSQLLAVLYSQLGKNFVLHGPPGTGKSQTIANIIAHNLACGRKVLFVSEKRAALEVVYRRLSALGLAPFCLELHSNKSGKDKVLAQFAQALAYREEQQPEAWFSLINMLDKSRQELNKYVAILHHRYPNGLSAYDCLARESAIASADPKLLTGLDCLTESALELSQRQELCDSLSQAWQTLTPAAFLALYWLKATSWSPMWEEKLLQSAAQLEELSRQTRALAQEICKDFLPGFQPTYIFLQFLAALGRQLEGVREAIPANFLQPLNPPSQPSLRESDSDFIGRLAEIHRQESELRPKLQAYNLDFARQLDLTGLQSRVAEIKESFILWRLFQGYLFLLPLKPLKKLGGKKLSLGELEELLPRLQKLNRLQSAIEEARPRLEQLLGADCPSSNPDWEHILKLLAQAREVSKNLQLLAQASDLQKYQSLLDHFRPLLSAGPDAQGKYPWLESWRPFLESWDQFQEKLQEFGPYFQEPQKYVDPLPLEVALQGLLQFAPRLRDYLYYLQLKAEAIPLHLQETLQYLERELPDPKELRQRVDRAHAKRMLNQIAAHNPLLGSLTTLPHNKKVQQFCQYDRQYLEHSRLQVLARLSARIPRQLAPRDPRRSELTLLKRECEKKTRHKPVRQLLEGLPHLASELKPCFLMSPLSVAQYLPPNSQLFDLIIFDEASQITVWDAIGVVARGRQLIVVGDRWQMPPTNFFQKGEGGEDDDPGADFQDLESILDECLAAGVYSSYLNWHYRSRHESLIAFSNHHYYEDKLATFPSARQGPRLGVKLNLVEGCYERSGSRTNKVEARALVDYIFRELEDPQGKPRSIGVVTFSQAQRDLIDDLLEEERLRHPHLESYFSEHLQDPIFVKNLENVQGDERELILFSIGYAPDKEGRFSLNFGPLNRQGGERRLNVAITRAQEQVVVFSSIRSTQIDLSRTSAKGAAHLKYFLEYAEKGSSWVPTSGPRPTLPPWLEEIALFLEEHDYKIERLWGHSQYPIDLAVYHPQKPQEFLLAIEGDGPGYARQYTTRDRDHLRWEVLRSLGWNLYRAWSNDWLWDRERCQKDLLATLARLQKEPAPTSKADASTKVASTSKKASARSTSTTESPSPAQATPTPQALPQASPKEIEENNYYLSAQDWQLLELAKVASAPAPLKSAPTSKLAPASKATATSKSTSTSKSASVSKATPTPKASSTPVDTTKRESPAPAAPASTAAQSSASKQNSALPQAYRVWRPSTISSWPLYSTGSHKTKLLHQVREILECEAPICASLLKKRLISAWDIKESDSLWLRAWSRVAPSALTATSLGKENVYWLKPNDWLEYQSYRLPTTQRSGRRFLWEIPPEEVANAMLAILRGQGAISMERLYQETLQIFQAGDLDAQLRPYLDTALQYLQTSGRLNAN